MKKWLPLAPFLCFYLLFERRFLLFSCPCHFALSANVFLVLVDLHAFKYNVILLCFSQLFVAVNGQLPWLCDI